MTCGCHFQRKWGYCSQCLGFAAVFHFTLQDHVLVCLEERNTLRQTMAFSPLSPWSLTIEAPARLAQLLFELPLNSLKSRVEENWMSNVNSPVYDVARSQVNYKHGGFQ